MTTIDENPAKKQKMTQEEEETSIITPAAPMKKPIYLDINEVKPMKCIRPSFKGAVLSRRGIIRLAQGCSLLMMDNLLSEVELKRYLEEAATINRVSGRAGFGIKPRKEMCYTSTGESFKYSGVNHTTMQYPDHVMHAISQMEKRTDELLLREFGHKSQFRALSSGIDIVYDKSFPRGGSICAHKDDEKKWDMVMIFSLGQTRYLRVRSDLTKEYINVEMDHNSLVVMYGENFQKLYTHQVDKLSENEAVGTRLSLNVRFQQ